MGTGSYEATTAKTARGKTKATKMELPEPTTWEVPPDTRHDPYGKQTVVTTVN
jgi:hypothetical protein